MQQDQIQRRPRLGFVFTLIILLGLLLLAAVSLVAWYQWRYNDKVYPGVSVAGMPLGDLTSTEAAGAIADALNPYPGPEITLRFEDRTWVLRAEQVGVSVDAGATAAAAFAADSCAIENSSISSSSPRFNTSGTTAAIPIMTQKRLTASLQTVIVGGNPFVVCPKGHSLGN